MKKGKAAKIQHRFEGKRFGRLIVLRRSPKSIGRPRWICVCDCGKKCTVRSDVLNGGKQKSCGCLRRRQVLVCTKVDLVNKVVTFAAEE